MLAVATAAWPCIAVSNLGPARRLGRVQAEVRLRPKAWKVARVFPGSLKVLFLFRSP